MDTGLLFLSFFISTVGYGYFSYGRKRPSTPFLISGVALMIYPYFVPTFWATLAIGALLLVVPFFL